MGKRDVSIDLAKGIGILTVVMGHVPLPHMHELYIVIYMFHMPLFFFLSGMMFRPSSNIVSGIKKKILTILLPYVSFSALGNLSFLIRDLIFGKDVSQYLSWSFFSSSSSPLWFLLCLFQVYLLAELICKISCNVIKVLVYSFVVAILGVLILKNNVNCGIPFFNHAMLMLPYYIIGKYIYKKPIYGSGITVYQKMHLFRFRSLLDLISVLLFVIVCTKFEIRPNVSTLEFFHPLWFVLGSFLGIYIILRLSKLFERLNSRFLVWVGQKSIYILGLHFFVIFNVYFTLIPITIRLASKFGYSYDGEYLRNSENFGFLVFIVVVPLTVIVSKILDKWIPCLFTGRKL